MWPRLFLTAAIITTVVGGVSAQTGTADGVAALARGDYQRAAEILKPIAEDLRTNDTAAQFFMAGLYETGRGVPADPLRACALYMRAASNHDNPFGQEAFIAVCSRSIARGREFDQECQLLANIGFDHGFEPVTFDLGPGHSIEWTLTAATVTYEGRTRREEMAVRASRGAVPAAAAHGTGHGTDPLPHAALHRDVRLVPVGAVGTVDTAVAPLRSRP